MSATKENHKKAVRAARVRELQDKVYEPSYMDAAIQRIALVLSRKKVEKKTRNVVVTKI